MEIRRGFGIAGSRTSGSVTVGDPLTLLIHMKSEKGSIFLMKFSLLVVNTIYSNSSGIRHSGEKLRRSQWRSAANAAH